MRNAENYRQRLHHDLTAWGANSWDPPPALKIACLSLQAILGGARWSILPTRKESFFPAERGEARRRRRGYRKIPPFRNPEHFYPRTGGTTMAIFFRGGRLGLRNRFVMAKEPLIKSDCDCVGKHGSHYFQKLSPF